MGFDEDFTADSFESAIEIFRENYFPSVHGEWIFRGQPKFEFHLVPSIGRLHGQSEDFRSIELEIFNKFKKLARWHTGRQPQNDYEWLAFGQHFGLPTRFLDWSLNVMVGLFFAVSSHLDTDGALFALRAEDEIDGSSGSDSPFDASGVARYTSDVIADRLFAQDGLFTLHGTPQQSLNASKPDGWELHRIRIKKDSKEDIQEQLYKQGIHFAKLFPDLDGLIHHLNWQHRVMASME